MSTLVLHHLPTEIKKRAMQEIYRVLTPGGRFLLADYGKPEGLLLRIFFALGALVQTDEASYIQDNKAGTFIRLPASQQVIDLRCTPTSERMTQ